MIDVVTGGHALPADALRIAQDDGTSGLKGSLTWNGDGYRLSDVGGTLTVDSGAGGRWPGVDGNVPSQSVESHEGHVFAVNRNAMGMLTANWRRISEGGNLQRLEAIWGAIAEGEFFANWSANPWWAHLDGLGREHAAPNDINGIFHLMSSRWDPDTQYVSAIGILRGFGVGVRQGAAGVELIDLLAPGTPYVDLAASLIDGLPEEAEGEMPFNRAGGYLNREIVVPFIFPRTGIGGVYRGHGISDAPPVYVRRSRLLESAKVEEQLQRNRLRLSATRVTVKLGCGWWGIEPGRGFRLPAALDPERRLWRTESVAMEMSGRGLTTTLQGRLHQPTDFWT